VYIWGIVMPFVVLEKLHQLYDGYRKPIQLAGQSLLLLQENGKTLLIKNQCPHIGAPLTHATCSENFLRCPMHGIEFDLSTGRSRSPICAQALQFYPLVYEGNTIGVDLR
jgi:nitrite reductase/ring-hydroxylating ferredoxin subunit